MNTLLKTAILLLISFNCFAGKPIDVINRLYHDYAWQAFLDSGSDQAHQNKVVLSKYFSPVLTSLLLKDIECAMKKKVACNLDFDMLFSSQDPAGTKIDASNDGIIHTIYKNPSTGKTSEIDYIVEKGNDDWLIADIIYKSENNLSLIKILSSRVK